jgi:hypothetical protein
MNIYAHECNRSACATCISSECSAQHESGLEAEQYLRRMPCSASKELAKPARRCLVVADSGWPRALQVRLSADFVVSASDVSRRSWCSDTKLHGAPV